MKSSRREKILAVIVGVMIIFILYDLFHMPEAEKDVSKVAEIITDKADSDNTTEANNPERTHRSKSTYPVQQANDNPSAPDPEAVPSQPAQYDFILSVNPITSDVSTIIVGKAKDSTRKSYVYADNSGMEDAEIQLISEAGKYYYRFKTSSESNPKDYEKDRIPFEPQGRVLGLNIMSDARNGDEDNSGVNLTLINDTDLKLYVKIDYDDMQRPRVNIVKKVGSISVN